MKNVVNRCKQFFLSTGSFLQERKCQGLPTYAIGVIVIGVILLALILVFVFGMTSEGTSVLEKLFGAQKNVTSGAAGVVEDFTGKFLQNFHK
ncbi:MAG: hypothetical protein PHH61_01925 [Candidatus Nanoarchaeia archaeon]|nr:hypothetical protein [Candidatus Nanoarchaeia archaeon]